MFYSNRKYKKKIYCYYNLLPVSITTHVFFSFPIQQKKKKKKATMELLFSSTKQGHTVGLLDSLLRFYGQNLLTWPYSYIFYMFILVGLAIILWWSYKILLFDPIVKIVKLVTGSLDDPWGIKLTNGGLRFRIH